MYCIDCGKEIIDGVKFCPNCGASQGREGVGAGTAGQPEKKSIPLWSKITIPFVVAAAVIIILYANAVTGEEQGKGIDFELINAEEDHGDISELYEEEMSIEEDDVIDESSFVWKVAPELEYEKIYYCWCGFYGIEPYSGYELDTETGLFGTRQHGGHGGGDAFLFYDEKKELYISYSFSESGEFLSVLPGGLFLSENPWWSEKVNAVQKIDSDSIKMTEHEFGASYDFSNAYIDKKYAVAYGITLVSDFIFDDVDRSGAGHRTLAYYEAPNKITMRLDGKWGVLDREGRTNAPFCFEDILLIDDESAFAKINGLYGILDLRKTSLAYREN